MTAQRPDYYADICSRERFARDIARHQLQVIHKNGLHKHLRFRRPDTMSMHFDIITWPGYLCYTGDMGTYVFRRIDDMLQFFRADDINPGYWGEKLESESCFGEGYMKYDPDLFRKELTTYINEEAELSEEDAAGLLESIEWQVFQYDSEYDMALAYNFDDPLDRVNLSDWLIEAGSFKKFTFHYIWCCRALQWATQLYFTGDRSTL